MAITHGQEPTVQDPLAAIREAYIKGTDPEAAVYGGGEQVETQVEAQVESEPEGSEPEETQAQAEASHVEAPTTPEEMDMETVFVRDAKGQKQKLEISYKDKQRIKEAFLKAAGMRKFQLERDDERKSKAELQRKYEELATDFGKLEQIYKEQGAKGIFEKLGGQGSWERAIEQELKHREHMASLSPEEKTQLLMQEKEKKMQSEKSELEKKYQDMLDKVSQEQERAATRALESRLVPSFEKYRFTGKLGDDVAEEKIDRAIWREVTEKLSEYPDDVELTQGLIDKEFRTVSAVYNKLVTKQVETKLQQTVAKKKEEAAQKAQVAVKKGITANSLQADIKNDIDSNNWSSLMQKVFSGKAKL